MIFRQGNAKYLRYLGGAKKLEFSKGRFIVSNQCSRDNINALIDLYSECEARGSARHVLNQMNKQNIVSGNDVMPGQVHNGFAFEVLRLFKSMVSESCPPNEYISGLVVSSCIDVGHLLLGRQCHGYLLKSGLVVLSQYVKTALVRLYSMLSDVVGAMEVSNIGLDTRGYNLMLVGLVEKGYTDEALVILRRMLAEDHILWNEASYIDDIFGLCAGLLDLDLGRQVHSKLLKSGVENDESVCSAMIKMYGNCGEILLARKVFDMFEPQNSITLTAMLAAYLEHESFEESLKLFIKMQRENVVVPPEESTFSVLLTASAGIWSNRCGKSLHALAEKTGLINGHKNVEDAMIDMYARTGDIKAAEKVFLGMTNYHRDIVTWNTMIRGYCHHHGLGNESLAMFQEMMRLGEEPNYDTFVGVLNACGQVGLVEEGFYYLYEFMKQKGVKPGLDHYMCIVRMLIRAGQLNEALSFIVSTPSKWDVYAWTSLISGCYAHGNYSVGIRAAELIPDEVATKVSEWGGVTQVRELMEIRDDIQEDGGLSWVEMNKDPIYPLPSVVKGDQDFVAVHKAMKSFRTNIMNCLLMSSDIDRRDVRDEINRDCDAYHSEELAVAYILINTDHRAPICVIKIAGKICGDCHYLMKCISKARRRLITVRDIYHFHNFQDGHCSCADNW